MTHDYMKAAIRVAKEAKEDCPIGCVVVFDGKIIASEHNKVEALQDPTAHAELLAIKSACSKLNTKYLNDVTMYCTLEPCEMCATAIKLAKIKKIVFGAFRSPSTHILGAVGGILEEECSLILKNFFLQVREKS